jgi:hypothetical protein
MIPNEARERAPAMEREVSFTGGAQGLSTRAFAAVPGHGRARMLRLVLVAAVMLALVLPHAARGQASVPSAPVPSLGRQTLPSRGPNGPTNPIRRPLPGRPASDRPLPEAPRPLATPSEADARPGEYKRFKVRDQFGECVVARFHGQFGDQTALILPDGQLGAPDRLFPTEEPFQPLTADQLEPLLHHGPYADYQVLKTEHYLIFYQSSAAFAQDSGRLLEDLYHGLIDAFRRHKIPVHNAEFPLVAVIFATEADFRKHKEVDPQVQAYYEFGSNQIFFYAKSARDRFEPKVAALLRAQTVAHEGAHQILSNIGLQPRPCAWPIWLVEGLAEYCATTTFNTKKGITWSGMGAINSLHMATIRELEDPYSNQINGPQGQPVKVSRTRTTTDTESLMLKTSLTPVDYAQAWAVTHYLALRRGSDFVRFLDAMKRIPPLVPRTPAENLAEFRKFFSDPAPKLDKSVDDYIHKLSQKKTYDSLFFYAVIFQQSLGNGVVRRAATVSQSPQFIQQWVQEMTLPHGDVPSWEASPWPTRSRAFNAIRNWMQNP